MADPPRSEPRSPSARLRTARERSARVKGRRAALIVYYVMVACIGTAAAAQITKQVFFEPGPPPSGSCHEGLRSLFDALARAREAAALSRGDEDAGADEGEDAALRRFRKALEPEWSYRDGVAARCRGSAKDAATLDAIERLRYAEEHAVRREAGELAPLRRKVQAIVDSELGR